MFGRGLAVSKGRSMFRSVRLLRGLELIPRHRWKPRRFPASFRGASCLTRYRGALQPLLLGPALCSSRSVNFRSFLVSAKGSEGSADADGASSPVAVTTPVSRGHSSYCLRQRAARTQVLISQLVLWSMLLSGLTSINRSIRTILARTFYY